MSRRWDNTTLRDRAQARREQAGWVPTVEEFALAVTDAAADEALESGATVYVGDTEF